jgi:hypothetical protein
VLIVRSRFGVPVRLTEERWRHIVDRHPEMDSQQEKLLETLAGPDMIQNGDFGELLAARLYVETPLSEKFLVVAYREVSTEDGFILTAYLTRRPSSRTETLWKR